MKKIISLVVPLVFSLNLFALAPEGQWPMKGNDAFGTHRNPKAVMLDGSRILWKLKVPKFGASSLVLDKEGNLYVSAHDYVSGNLVMKVSPEGEVLWVNKTEEVLSYFQSTPIVADDGYVYLMSESGDLWRFSQKNGEGEEVAKFDLSGVGDKEDSSLGRSHIIMDNDGTIYANAISAYGRGDYVFMSYNPESKAKYRTKINDYAVFFHSPVMDTNNRILFYDTNNIMSREGSRGLGFSLIRAFNPKTKKMSYLKSYKGNGMSYSVPAVDPDSGAVYGESDFAHSTRLQPAIGPRHLYTVAKKNKLVAWDKKSGEKMWHQPITTSSEQNSSSPIVDSCGNVIVGFGAHGEAYGGYSEGAVKAYTPEGKEIFSIFGLTGGHVGTTPALADSGVIYIKAGSELYAIGGNPVSCK